MKTENVRKVAIKVDSNPQQEIRNIRKTKVLKDVTKDKENVVKPTTFVQAKLASEKEKAEAKKKSLQHKAVQTFEDYTVSELDLTSDEPPNEEYWRRLAEKRGEALNDSLHENERLKENIEALQEENQVCKNMLDESRHLVEILQEMLDDSQTEED
ncbi:dynamin-like protein 1 [Aethina tumida]|uniref:dynamin-like protein 1 n=1 Tax=Aethina tumida TaxID=116153 RepID=UPI00096B1685|nr:dynamin-like protein 1 [Aethina tumida]